jgi:citrate synthase
MGWLTAGEALSALGVQPQTLYANVSRGRIRAKPDPNDSRRSLYDKSDIERLARRRAGRRTVATVAAETIGWGDPILASSVSTVADGRLLYRGVDAINFSETATLEDVARLLWSVEVAAIDGASPPPPSDEPASPLAAALVALAKRAEDPPSRGRSRSVLAAEAGGLVDTLAIAMLGRRGAIRAPLHRRLAQAWRAKRAEDALRRALTLLADHELNASTFAARVAVSTGAPLAAGLLAGLATLSGPLHGGAVRAARALAARAAEVGAERATREWLAQGRAPPAFGHPLYPNGDPRAVALLAHFTLTPVYADILAAAEALIGERPSVDFALAAMCNAYALPDEAPFTIFAIARSVGWIAHALEQAESGLLIRPRARYVGPPANASA